MAKRTYEKGDCFSSNFTHIFNCSNMPGITYADCKQTNQYESSHLNYVDLKFALALSEMRHVV